MGKTPARNTPAFWNGTNVWVSISDLTSSDKYISQTRECITDDAITRTGIKKVPKDTLLMSFKLSLGKVAITAADIYTNEAIMAFIDKKTHDVDIHYMYHYFQAIDWTIGTNKAVKGVTLNKIVLSEKVIELPPINIQHEIAERMDNLNAVTKNLQHQLTLFDELVKSRFVELFGDPVTNPMGWEVKKLKDICAVGSSKRIYQREQTSTGVPFLRISDLVTKITSQEETSDLYISDEKFNKFEQQGLVPKTGDILVTARGTLGLCYIIKPEDRFYFQDGMISWVHTSEANVNSVYISYLFDSQGIKKQIDRMVTGSTVDYLSIAQLGQFDILLPPLALQNEFAAFVEQVDKSKLVLRQLLEKQRILKAALMQEYFAAK